MNSFVKSELVEYHSISMKRVDVFLLLHAQPMIAIKHPH